MSKPNLAEMTSSYEKKEGWKESFLDRHGMSGPRLFGDNVAEHRHDGWYWELFGPDARVTFRVPGTDSTATRSVRELGALAGSYYDRDEVVAIGLRNGVNGSTFLVSLR